jgi:hypothetical protein
MFLDAGDFQTVTLVKGLRIFEWTVKDCKPACEVHQILVTDVMNGVVFDGLFWIEQLLEIGTEDLR